MDQDRFEGHSRSITLERRLRRSNVAHLLTQPPYGSSLGMIVAQGKKRPQVDSDLESLMCRLFVVVSGFRSTCDWSVATRTIRKAAAHVSLFVYYTNCGRGQHRHAIRDPSFVACRNVMFRTRSLGFATVRLRHAEGAYDI